MGILLLGTPQILSSGFRPLNLGASGFITGSATAPDGSIAIRTDSYGGYIWDPAQITPVGNAGGTGGWRQLITAKSLPANLIPIAMLYGGGVYELAFAPSNSSILYMMYVHIEQGQFPARMQLYKSTDKGVTFTETGFASAVTQGVFTGPIVGGVSKYDQQEYKWWGQKMCVHPTDPNTLLMGTPNNGLWYSQDGGTSWTQVSTSQVPVSTADSSTINHPGISGIRFQPGTPNTIYASSFGNGTYKCTSGVTSATWTKITSSGVGPVSVRQADLSSNGVYYVTDDDHSGGPAGGNIWTWDGSWHKRTTDSAAFGIACDQNTAAHAVAVAFGNGITGQGAMLNECNNDGVTFNGWSLNGTYVSADIPFMAVEFTSDAYGIFFDKSTPGRVYTTGDRGVTYADVTFGSITTSTNPTFNNRSVGIEELVVIDVIWPPGGTPITTTWDTAAFRRPVANWDSFPTSSVLYKNNVLAAGWNIDYASNDSNFIAILADGNYAGGPQAHAFSTDGGQNWTAYSTPYSSIAGGIAVSTSTNVIWFGGINQQPYYTTNFGASPTWHPVDLSSFGISSWSGFGSAFFANGNRWIIADKVNTGQFTLMFPGVGFFLSTDGGATWSKTANTSAGGANIPSIRPVPGQANHIWWSEGNNGHEGQQPVNSALRYSTNAGVSWTTVSNVYSPWYVGFGCHAPGQTYPAVYMVGNVSSSVPSSSITVPSSGNVPINFTCGSGLDIAVGTIMMITDGGSRQIWGTISTYTTGSGAATFTPYFYTGSGSASAWTAVFYGFWRTIAGPSATPAWKQLSPFPGQHDFSLDTACCIAGDMNTYGKVIVGSGSTGFSYAQFN